MWTKFRIPILAFLLVGLSLSISAQTVSGTVKGEDGEPLIGVNVTVDGTSLGTITDFNGAYEITVGNDGVLHYSYIGYTDKNVAVNGQNRIDVVMSEGVALNEVVVTALGISREKKALGYAIDQISSDEITKSGQTNIVTALQGRTAGVTISSSSGAAGGSADILIRGVSSLSPGKSNRPLYVIDGIEISDDVDVANITSANVSLGLGASSRTQSTVSNRAVDINPDDIESISILKGASATALYGIRAANGVILITTKKGSEGAPKVTISYATGRKMMNKSPKVQMEYIDGHRSTSLERSFIWDTWGTPAATSEKKIYDTHKEFYRTGVTHNVGASVAAGSDNFKYRISGNFYSEEGIVPNTQWGKKNFSISTNYDVNDRLTIGASVIFSKSGGNRPYEGRKSIMNVLNYMSPVVNPNEYHTPYTAGTNFAVGIIDHPLYLSEVNSYVDDVNRYITGATAKYRLTSNIGLNYNLGFDNYSDSRRRIVDRETDEGNNMNGFVSDIEINSANLTSNLFLDWNKSFSDNFSLSGILGQYIYTSDKTSLVTRGEGLDVPGFYNLYGATNYFQSNSDRKYRNAALYGEITAGYKSFLYLTVTGRNDWSSSLPVSNNSYFFPSVSASFVLSDMPGFNVDAVSFAKLRASYAIIGKDTEAYRIGSYYQSGVNFPFNETVGFGKSRSFGDEELRPEFTKSTELGLDVKLFNNRVGFDVSVYQSNLEDMILPVAISNAAGYSSFVTNAGSMTSKGVELMVYGEPIKGKNFSWFTSVIWSKNEGEIIEIDESIENIELANIRNVTNKYVRDGKVGDLYGAPFHRNDNGDLIIYSDGYPRLNRDTTVYMGNANPDFIANWSNDFSFKQFGLSFMWEWKKGGKLIDVGRVYAIDNGQLEETLDRHKDLVINGVNEVLDGDGNVTGYQKNDIHVDVSPAGFYRSSSRYRYAPEVHLQDASWIRLRNINLSYTVPQRLFENMFINGAALTLTANNVYLNTPFKGFDPESNYFGAGSNIGGYTGLKTPGVKSYTIKLNLTF